MDALTALFTRRSLRDYRTEAPSRETILRLIEAATMAPSAFNRQCLSYTVVQDRALLDRLSQEAKTYMAHERPVELPEALAAKLTEPAFHLFYRAPVVIVFSAPEQAPWIIEDAALASENMMLAAHALGLGSCWIGLALPWLSTTQGRQSLGLSETQRPVAAIAIGFPATPVTEAARRTPDIYWIA